MRCKACNTILDEFELMQYDKLTKLPLDLCLSCLSVSEKTLTDNDAVVDITYDREYNDIELDFYENNENLI